MLSSVEHEIFLEPWYQGVHVMDLFPLVFWGISLRDWTGERKISAKYKKRTKKTLLRTLKLLFKFILKKFVFQSTWYNVKDTVAFSRKCHHSNALIYILTLI